MNGTSSNSKSASGRRKAAAALFLTALLFSTTGLSCGDIPFASGTFRDAAMGEISTGVKNIVNGIVDGIFAVIADAGDGDGSAE